MDCIAARREDGRKGGGDGTSLVSAPFRDVALGYDVTLGYDPFVTPMLQFRWRHRGIVQWLGQWFLVPSMWVRILLPLPPPPRAIMVL